MAKKIVHGSPVPQFTIFPETERFVRSYIAQRSMFPYMLRITPCDLRHIEFAEKDGHREGASTAVLVLGRSIERCDGLYTL